MPSRVLGVSCFYHDSAAALVQDGRLIAACAEDRFSRVKHDSSFPVRAMTFCLERAGIPARDLDAVVFYERPQYKFIRVLRMLLSRYPRGAGKFAQAMVPWIGEKLWLRVKLSETLEIDPSIIRFVEHHESHASYAFHASPYQSAAVLTLDGVGEDTCGLIGRASRSDGITTLERTRFPDSLGLVYAAITGYLGFKPNDGECNTMALAAFGQPTELKMFEQILRYSDHHPRVGPEYFDFTADESQSYRPKLLHALGARHRDAGAGFSSWPQSGEPPPDESRRAANIAASIQRRTEDLVLEQARRARKLSGEKSLCFAGGVALNAVAVGRLIREAGFESVFIPPDPGDGGCAVGAAFLGAVQCGDVPAAHGGNQIYSGPVADPATVIEMLPHLDPAQFSGFTLDGVEQRASTDWRKREFEDLDERAACVADWIAKGAIVGWMCGPSEFGPRALGARSILCDPGNLATAQRLSRLVKLRAAFRPYALSVSESDAARLFVENWRSPAYRWMQATAEVRPEMRQRVQAALHVDGTTRPQICTRDDHPAYFALLRAIGERTGLAAVLNTSLNDSGEPLAATAEEGLLMLARTDMDVLVIDSLIIEKGEHS